MDIGEQWLHLETKNNKNNNLNRLEIKLKQPAMMTSESTCLSPGAKEGEPGKQGGITLHH